MVPILLLFLISYFQEVFQRVATAKQVISGRYTKDVTDYEIVLPRKVKPNGAFHAFWLPHHYDERLRKKRSLGEEDKVHYSLEFNGDRYHLELTPNVGLLSPAAVVETWRTMNLSTVEIRHPTNHLCHYYGIVRQKPGSKVAMSACSGLAGHIRLENDIFLIEPLMDEKARRYGEHLHIVYKRTLKDGEVRKRRCGSKNEKWWEQWPQEMFKDKIQSFSKGLGLRPFLKRATEEVVPRYIEAGLILDKKFCSYHKDDNKEEYALTTMNIANTFYRDGSTGTILQLIITKMVFLDVAKQEVELEVLSDADKGLPLFCEWQTAFNHKDESHPNHYDIAVLITRHDICSEGDCGLLGLAFMSKVCSTEKLNCCINEDSGLVIGAVVTHEIGHLMGCSHDDVSISGCTGFVNEVKGPDAMHTVMHPVCTANTLEWSSCSRGFLSTLINTKLAECLLDEPTEKAYKYKDLLPGIVYDADKQCKLMFGESFVKCDIKNNPCTKLWCTDPTGSKTGCNCLGGPADGTECGPNKWCFKGECVERGVLPKSVDGGWSGWGAWSKCSRTCGGGVESRERVCNNPQPAHLGKYCQGTRKEFAMCNTKPCDNIAKYRAQQCTEYDSKEVFGGKFTWKPHNPPRDDPDFCKLYCINEKRVLGTLAPMVADGTRCHPGTKDTCIQGNCVKVGCDWKIDSGAVEDVCGVCNGDGTHCVSKTITFKDPPKKGLVIKVCTVPKGSSNVVIRELSPCKNYLHFAPPSGTSYLPNKPNSPPGEYKFGEDTAILSYPQLDHEELYMKGPIKAELIVSYAFLEVKNPGVTCTFVSEVKKPNEKPSYSWEFINWGPCSVKCGSGSEVRMQYKVSQPDCVEKYSGKVSDSFCDSSKKPEPQSRTCNQKKCRTHWKVWKWSECSGCLHKTGERHREVECIQDSPTVGSDNDIIVEASKCCGKPPKKTELCNSSKPCEDKRKKRKKRIDDIFTREFARYNVKTSDLENYKCNFYKRSDVQSTDTPESVSKDTLYVDVMPIENVTMEVAQISECEEDPMQLSEEAYESEGNVVPNKIISNVETFSGKDAIDMINEARHVTPTPAKVKEKRVSNTTSRK